MGCVSSAASGLASILSRSTEQSCIYVQGSPSGGGHVPPGGDASRMTTTDDEVFMQKVYIGGMRSGKNVDNIIRYHRHLEEEGWILLRLGVISYSKVHSA